MKSIVHTENEVFLLINQGESIPNSDLNLLETIANTCPLEGGYAVYGARGLLNVYFGNLDMFENTICDDNNQSRSQRNFFESDNVYIFPNPNNGQFILANIPSNAISVQVLDITGKSVYLKNTNTENTISKLNIDIPDCQSGMYFYSILREELPAITGKFIITK